MAGFFVPGDLETLVLQSSCQKCHPFNSLLAVSAHFLQIQAWLL